VRAAHYNEFEQLLAFAKSNGMDKLAFVHADNDNGRSHLANVGKLTRQLGIADVIGVPATAGADGKPDVRAMAEKIAGSKAKGVFNHGSYLVYADLIRILHTTNPTVQFMAVNSGAQQMIEALGKDGKGIVFTQVVPFPFSDSKPLVGEYRKALATRKADAQPSFSELEGYMTAKALAAGLRRATRTTSDGIVSAFESLSSADLGGVVIRYSATAHNGSEFVETVIASSDGKFRR
jgi:ABC-type branched-subunit amino acid transport system substrate-binding protein